VPPPMDTRQPKDQFLREPQLEYLIRNGRRLLGPAAPVPVGVDRPVVKVLSSRMVTARNGQFSVVGEVLNADADPADLTVRATIYDDAGAELTWYNATDVAIHKVLPYEVAPFRVDFEGVAGLALEDAGKSLSFMPGASSVYTLSTGTTLGAYNVFPKAVVTQYDLDREVGMQNIRFAEEAGALTLRGQLVNSGLGSAVVPHVVVTLYDDLGNVQWVDHAYTREWVPAQGSLDFAMALTPARDLGSVGLRDPTMAPATAGTAPVAHLRDDFIPLPPASGYAYARVSVNYYAGQR